ncbi:membrane protein insertion efficiency factor YidD [Ruminococcaceae bacterium OttesenSCG-928-O06]|nr:membrane protein insertion efficiency factor YidD [Ruminococcaceae bacterium OttesenSCG-928-O06]
MKTVLLALLRGYKKYISPRMGNNCRFSPTCSEYAMQAITLHGAVKGGLLSLWRFLRCNPFGKAGYDPVPPKGKWTSPDKRVRKA